MIAEEKRRQDAELRKKKRVMLENFENLAQKARYNRDEFYREVFTPRSRALLSNYQLLQIVFGFHKAI